MKRFFILLASCFLLLTSSVFAATGTSLNVAIGDPAYEYIDKLVASKLIKTPIYGIRPWTRLYVAKMVKEALENRDKLDTRQQFIGEILDKMKEEYAKELKVVSRQSLVVSKTNGQRPTTNDYVVIHPLSSISTTYTYLDNNPSPVPANGLGSIDAVVHPLVANRQGRQYEKGHHFYWETEHSAQISPYFAAYAKPQFQFRFPDNSDEKSYAYLHNLYAKTGWRNAELEIGRDQMLWGQGLHGGLLFSDNPRGLDMIRFTTPYPLRLPWVFKHLGNFKWTGFFGNLGPEQAHKNPWLMGWQLTWQPWHWWEIGAETAVIFGGEGSAFLNPLDFWRNFSLMPYQTSGDRNTNRILGLNSRWTVPPCRGLQIYGEVIFEDHTNTWSMIFGHDSAWLTGFYMPRLDYAGKWSGRIEYERPNNRLYRHAFHTSGWTLNRQLLGAMMGSDADRATTTVAYYITPSSKLEGNFTFLHRSSNTYDIVGENKDVNRAFDGPEEYHALNIYTLEIPIGKQLFGMPDFLLSPPRSSGGNRGKYPLLKQGAQRPYIILRTSFGWDYVINKDFIQGNKKADFLGEIGLKMNFPEF